MLKDLKNYQSTSKFDVLDHSRELKMLGRQGDHYAQNKIIHTNGSKENLLFIINRMILI